MNKQLFLMMGAPGSGKSTWLYKNAQHPGDQVISRDVIRFNLLQEGEDYFSHEGTVYQQFVEAIVKQLKNVNVQRVFADASHLNAPSRTKLLIAIDKMLEQKYEDCIDNYDKNVIWLRTTLDTCIKRNNTREGRAKVPEDTIISMWKSQTMPRAEEGFDKIYILNEKTESIDIVELDAIDFNNFYF